MLCCSRVFRLGKLNFREEFLKNSAITFFELFICFVFAFRAFHHIVCIRVSKVTEFLVKLSKFKFLVMTEKMTKGFLSFKKPHPFFPSNSSLKIEILSKPPLFENLLGGSSPSFFFYNIIYTRHED